MRDAPPPYFGLFHPQVVVPLLFHKVLALDRMITQRVGQLLGHNTCFRVGAVVGQAGDGDRGLGLPGHGTATLLLVVRRRAVFSDEAPGRRRVALVIVRGLPLVRASFRGLPERYSMAAKPSSQGPAR